MLDEGVVEAEDFAELLVVHVGKPGFARAHGHVGDGLLGFQQRVDFFFERSLGNEPVDLHIARLPDTEGAGEGEDTRLVHHVQHVQDGGASTPEMGSARLAGAPRDEEGKGAKNGHFQVVKEIENPFSRKRCIFRGNRMLLHIWNSSERQEQTC